MRAEVHLIDARLTDVLARVDTGESGAMWQSLVAAKAAYYAAKEKDREYTLTVLLSKIDKGAADYAAWQDVRSLLEQRRRTVESERKRLVEMQQMVTTERLMLFVSSLAQVVRDSIFANVQDQQQARRALADASSGIERLISVGAGSTAPGEPVE